MQLSKTKQEQALTPIAERIIAAGEKNHNIVVKPYTILSDNVSNIPRLHENLAKIDVELVEKSLSVKVSEKGFEFTILLLN